MLTRANENPDRSIPSASVPQNARHRALHLIFLLPFHHGPTNSRLLVGLVLLAGTLMLACSGEPKGDQAVKPKVVVAQQDPGGRSAGQQPDGGEQSGQGGQRGGPQSPGGRPLAGLPPWLQPKSDCKPKPVSIYYNGIILDMNTGASKCSRDIIVCSESISSVSFYNYSNQKCPWAEGTTIAYREDGMAVCCAEWEKAKLSGSPCDPRVDADCDGIPNDEDPETLRAAAPHRG